MSDKKRKLFVRIMCWILAIVMFLGGATLAISMLVSNVAAEEIEYNLSDYNFSSTDGDTYIAVGLMYGSSVTVGFEIKAPYGFVVGKTQIQKDLRSFESVYVIEDTIAAATLDGNLSKSAMTYSLANKASSAVIGGYHLELAHASGNMLPLATLESLVNEALNSESLYAIPTINGDSYRIRIGSYKSIDEANAAYETYKNFFTDFTASVVSPSMTCTSVVNPTNDKILFEYESGDTGANVGFSALQGDAFTSYIQTPADNLYGGVMCFVPQISDSANGVKLINLLDLESYVEGVVPYEISNSWHMEVLRTYALAARSYALSNYNKRFSTYGCDLVCTASDQVYRGHVRVNDAVKEAVKSTAGLVISYGGEICGSYYSSSVGGSTVSSQYVWGSERGYLTHVSTPWERYSEYNKGLWRSQVSGKELCDTLRRKGYTEVSGAIDKITYTTADDGSGYVYTMTFTDTNGKSVTLKRSDIIRTVLSSYLNSANFIVGKGTLEFTYDSVVSVSVEAKYIDGTHKPEETKPGYVPMKGYLSEDPILVPSMNILTADGVKVEDQHQVTYVLTSTGRKVTMSGYVAISEGNELTAEFKAQVPTLRGYVYDPTTVKPEINDTTDDGFDPDHTVDTITPIIGNRYVVVSEYENVKITTYLDKITETITASSSGHFIFAGKGWGHGVGLSQYGAKDLADAGVKAEDIISIYLADTQIVPYFTIANQ